MGSVITASRSTGHSIRRCPGCGQRVGEPIPTCCPLCGLSFGGDSVTGADVTPYAKAYSLGASGWRRMAEWIWFAPGERLKHLALMRSSAASARLVRLNGLLLLLAAVIHQVSQVGWRWVTASPAIEATGSLSPAGSGWFHVAIAPRPFPVNQPDEIAVDLWWNPLQALVVAGLVMLSGWLLFKLVMYLIRLGVRRAHQVAYRGEKRMTAALHYSTAWCIPIFVGSLFLALRPLSYIGSMGQWSWSPPGRAFILPAAVLAGFGAAMWWFWLLRLGSTAPAKTRFRVSLFFGVVVPVLCCAAAIGWKKGLNLSYEPVFSALKISF